MYNVLVHGVAEKVMRLSCIEAIDGDFVFVGAANEKTTTFTTCKKSMFVIPGIKKTFMYVIVCSSCTMSIQIVIIAQTTSSNVTPENK